MNRERLERYVLAIAGGWYAVPQGVQRGENEEIEAPRAIPALTNMAIVDAAVDLMRRVDEAEETVEIDVKDLLP